MASIVVIGLTSVSLVRAESSPTREASQASVYVPSVSDLMITTIQPRHVRLWRAGQGRNWEFADYELGNLKGAFRRLGIAHPVQGDVPLQDMIDSVTQQPFSDLENAIKAKEPSAFEQAYLGLTTACNSCHEAVNHSAIKIKVPEVELTGPEDDLDLNTGGR
jgi:hypothetical protein